MGNSKQSTGSRAGEAKIVVDIWRSSRLFVSDATLAGLVDSVEHSFLLGLIRAREWRRIIETCEDRLSACNSRDQHRFYSQLSAFFKKNDSFRDTEVCRTAAHRAFKRGELLCRLTNKRLDYFAGHVDRLDDLVSTCLPRIRGFIADVLGSVDDFVGNIPTLISVTSGATASSTRERSLPHLKMRRTYDVTQGALPYLLALTRLHTGASCEYRVVCSNRITTVPKTSLTDRTIACEPMGNLPFQLAVDAYLKGRLRSYGIDLSDQTRNKRLAREGSISDNLATIDLTMASDTLSLNTVLWLLPEEWTQHLMRLRSSHYRLDGGIYQYHKFSSMGNGFTFTLETLLFSALCAALGSKKFSVYGDDIILESHHYSDLVSLLRFFGFTPNQAKSFASGPFRESCGGDYWLGVDVRAFYWRTNPRMPTSACHLINGLLSICVPRGSLWDYLIELVQKNRLLVVPFNESSTSGIHIHPYDAHRLGLVKTEYGQHTFRGYSEVSPPRLVQGIRPYLLWCLKAFKRGSGDPEFSTTHRLPLLEVAIGSEAASLRTKVRKGKRVWFLPDVQIPHHLYVLSESLT